MSGNFILEKLKGIQQRFIEVGELITQPDIIADMKKYVRLNKEYKELEPLIEVYKSYKNVLGNIKSSKEILATEDDAELREMAKDELEELNDQVPELEEEIKLLLIPK
ncbi:MAG TPA: peptide chain release factor 1, partial [Bacteroidales bacterium]|nr:peptide chain release factor 1 [Bacteroidales bacterium]